MNTAKSLANPRTSSSMVSVEKEELALAKIEAVTADGRAPVVFSSFGKDSLVLIHLTRRVAPEVPIAYFELGTVPEKHRFSSQFVKAFGAQVTVLRPHRTVTVSKDGATDLGYEIRLSTGDVITILGATFREGMASEMFCAVEDGLLRKGGPRYPWSTVLCGRKRCDHDVTVGSLEWNEDETTLPSGARIVMPLLDWSDAEVFAYLNRYDVAFDTRRYFVSGDRLAEFDNKQLNPDHLVCCTRCTTAPRGSIVDCPKTNGPVTSFAGVEEGLYEIARKVSPTYMF